MLVCAIASGSAGNCFYITSGKCSILVDAGVSAREIENSLLSIGKNIGEIEGVFITHEHGDHVRGCDMLHKRHSIPIYMNKSTYDASRLTCPVSFFETNLPFAFGDLSIHPFSKYHDAAEPVSFFIQNSVHAISVITDIGHGCSNCRKYIEQSHILMLEANHDSQLLSSGPYPTSLKDRILGSRGHLSNYEGALLVLEHGRLLQHLFLTHLSNENNSPKIALKTYSSLLSERSFKTYMTYPDKVSGIARLD